MASTALWLLSSALLLSAGVFGPVMGRRGRSLPAVGVAAVALAAILGAAAGLFVRGAANRAWLGAAAADALALLAIGGLAGEIWLLSSKGSPRYDAASGASYLSVALLGLLLAGAAWMADPVASSVPEAGAWTFALRNVLAGLGTGVWIPALAATLIWTLRGDLATPAEGFDPALPPGLHGMKGRAGDPGRAVALAGYPLLTAAWLAGGVWNVLSYAAPWRAAPAELWLLAAWTFGAAYFHATSGWRPLRIPRWVALALAVAAAAAGIAAALTAASLGSG